MSEQQEKKGWSTLTKILVGIGAVFFLLIVVGIVASIVMVPKFKQFQSKAKQVEAKSTLSSAYITFQADSAEFGKFTAQSFETWSQDYASISGGNSLYTVVLDPATDPVAQQHCADCGVTNTTFKIVAYGNLDDDETIDVWTMDHEKNLVNVINDIEN